MNAIAKAIRLCHTCGYRFWEQVHNYAHKRGGLVIVSREAVLLAEVDGTTAFLWIACGGRNCLLRFIQLAPPELLTVQWAKEHRGRRETRTYQFDRVKRIIMGGSKQPASPPPPPPVATAGGIESVQAQRSFKRTESKRKGFQASLLAGETNSGSSYQSDSGMRSLLG